MLLNFLSSAPVVRPAQAFQRIFDRRGFLWALGVASVLLLAHLYMAVFDLDMSGDEAEHLHVIYALERGEVPYREFLENHPVFFHLIVLQFKQLFGLSDAAHVYLLAKVLVFLHIIACIALITLLLRRFCEREFSAARWGFIFIIALAVLGIWSRMGAFWNIRPDWVALFYAYLAAVSHFIMLQRLIDGRRYSGWLILGAASSGLGAAALSKAIYIIIPYMMTLFLATALAPRDWLKMLSTKMRSLFWVNVVFAALSVLFLAGFVFLELRLTRTGLMDYIHSNYSLNSIKHTHVSSKDYNPFNMLRRILNLPSLLAYILALGCIPVLLALHDRKKYLFRGLIIFAGLTILFNASFPAWSHGVTYPHYFIPSAMALALYITITIICLLHYVAPAISGVVRRHMDFNQGFAAAWLATAFVILFYMTVSSVSEAGLKMVKRGYEDDKALFDSERQLPSDLNYLTFYPEYKPVTAPAWGHFFHLMASWNFWPDAHELGVAPDPARHWRDLYEKSPPDAIAAPSLEELQEYVRIIKERQGADVDWLVGRVREDYACITRGLPIYVRKDLAPRYLQDGWKRCDDRN